MAWLLLGPLLLGLLTENRGERWNNRLDLPLSVLLGAGMALMEGVWLARFHLRGSAWVVGDFWQYCDVVEAGRRGTFSTEGMQRSAFLGWAYSPLTRVLGLFDGMAAASLISVALVGVGLYTWAFALGGRRSAVAAVIVAGAFPALVLQTRTLTFYPTFCASIALSAGCTALAIRYRSPASLAWAGAGMGLALLVDLKAISWVLPLFACALLAPLFPREGGWKQRIAGLFALATPILLSYKIGGHFWPPARGAALEDQIASYVGDVFRRAHLAEAYSHEQLTTVFCPNIQGFRWGSSPIGELPSSLNCAHTLLALIPDSAPLETQMHRLTEMHYDPLLPWVEGGLAAAALLLLIAAVQKRSGWRLAALAGTLAPFYLPFLAIPQEASLRRVAPAILFLPVVLGVVYGGLQRVLPALWTRPVALPVRVLGGLLPPLLLLLAVLGVVQTPLSPTYSRQNSYMETGWEDIGRGFRTPHAGGTGQQCGVGRMRDIAAGQPEQSRFSGWYPLLSIGH
ncbi:MAG TPA: hypothetical protein PLA94_07955 [Myxococcota bacterium]|nr:hypothetical protein [Myxococcota bacterium]